MNRLESFLVPRESFSSIHVADSYDSSSEISLGFPHRVFMPEYYEAGYQYPLVIWLHSDDSSEFELDEMMQSLSLRNYVGLGLRGTLSGSKRGRSRWSLSSTAQALHEEMIFQAIDEVSSKVSIQTKNVFLAGFGKGGTLAQHIALRNPTRFAAAISINGRFPQAPRTLVRWKQAKQLPILWMHGVESQSCGTDAMCDMLKSAYTAGLRVFPIQFPVADELDQMMLNKANRFMMQIVTGESIQLCESVA